MNNEDFLLDQLTPHDLRIVGDVIHLAWVLQEELHQTPDEVACRISKLCEFLIESRRNELVTSNAKLLDHLSLDSIEVSADIGLVRAA